MKCVFTASTGLEAHMIANQLQQSGIETRIDGEYLQGGTGGIQAANMVSVLVEDVDYVKALEIIEAWDMAQVDALSEYSHKHKSNRIGTGLVLGLLIGFGATYWAYFTSDTYNGIDYDGDGILDERYEYRDNRLYRAQADRNFDGLVDVIHRYSREGRIYKTEADDNFDGTFETTVKYKHGNPFLTEVDTDQDGEINTKIHVTNGVLSVVEILGPTPSSPKVRQHFKMNKLVFSEFDSNGDGIYDKKYTYDYYEQVQNEQQPR